MAIAEKATEMWKQAHTPETRSSQVPHCTKRKRQGTSDSQAHGRKLEKGSQVESQAARRREALQKEQRLQRTGRQLKERHPWRGAGSRSKGKTSGLQPSLWSEIPWLSRNTVPGREPHTQILQVHCSAVGRESPHRLGWKQVVCLFVPSSFSGSSSLEIG